MTGFLAAALKLRNEKPAPGLNKLALANVYRKSGMPWRAIEVLESAGDSYRPDAVAEARMAAELKAKYPDWQIQRDARNQRPSSILTFLRAAWRRITSL